MDDVFLCSYFKTTDATNNDRVDNFAQVSMASFTVNFSSFYLRIKVTNIKQIIALQLFGADVELPTLQKLGWGRQLL